MPSRVMSPATGPRMQVSLSTLPSGKTSPGSVGCRSTTGQILLFCEMDELEFVEEGCHEAARSVCAVC